jgi:hypothetical protein
MNERPTPETDAAWQADKDTVFRVETSRKLERERDEALMDRSNGDIATMTINHYNRIFREREEALEEIQRLRYDAQKEAEHHDRIVKELKGLYDQIKKTQPDKTHICAFHRDMMGNCMVCGTEEIK